VAGHVGDTLELALPVWTPGSYLVRDYARHVECFSAENGGQPLAWQKTDKTTWQIATNGSATIQATYQVYAFELSVRTSHLDDTHGYFNPATLCMFVPGRTEEPHYVTIMPPAGWRVTTGLPASTNHSLISPSFIAEDYDELVDSPFECGTHRLLTFEVEGVPHEIALWGHGNENETQLVADTKAIVEATRALFSGPLPYRRYVFIVHLSDGLYGGLEHRNSVSNILDRWTFQPTRAYERYLGLTSHEYYHVWNVKRIRPAPLGPFDYRRENYTRNLWVAEGITNYYDNLILVRGGLITSERYLETLADDIEAMQSQPGRAIQSLTQSSFDTWIKFYRPDENSSNSSISYYLKGSMVALLLDLHIRGRSRGTKSLDDVLRYLFSEIYGGVDQERFYEAPAFAEDGGFLAAVEAVAGSDDSFYQTLLTHATETTEELDYTAAFNQIGMQLEWGYKHGQADDPPPATLGLKLKSEHGRTKVVSVSRNGPAEQAGIYAGDELLAFEGFRINEEKLQARLSERQPGDQVRLTVFRGDRLLEITAILGAAPFDTLRLVPDPDATEAQQMRYRHWLKLDEDR
jgi:predicted metalloprotease with PDZ domain